MFNDLLNDKPGSTGAALSSAEADLVHILQQVPAAIAILKGPRLVVEVANAKTLEIWGKAADEVIGRPVLEIFPELVRQGFDKILERVYTTGERYVANEAPVELVRHGKFETLYINFSYDPYHNKAGEVIGIISTGADVTELVRTHQNLLESNERSRMAIELAGMGTWDYNPANNTIICSVHTMEVFGFPPGEGVTLEMVHEAVVEKDRQRVKEAIGRALEPSSGGHYDIEYSLVNKKDGKLRTVKAKGRAFFDNGTPYRFIGTVLDITQEMRAREEQRKLVTLVDNSIELMSILELDGRNSYLNKAGMQMLGFDSEEQVPLIPISELHTPEDIAFVEANVIPSVMTTGRWSGVMNVRHLQSGEVFPVYNNTIRIDDPATGAPMAIGAVMRDMRPELAAQKVLAESEVRLRNVLEQAHSPILILKGEDMVLEVANGALLEFWGVGSEALGKKFLDILPEMEGQGFMELLLSVYHHNQLHYGYEVPVLFNRANGEKDLRYCNFVYQPYKEPGGDISGVLVIASDVTGQVLAQRKLLKSETTLKLAVEAAHLGVYELDMVKGAITHSPKTAEIFGLPANRQWPLDAFRAAVHPNDVDIRTRAHERALQTGALFYEVRIYWPDGSLHWIRLNGQVVVRAGKAVSIVGTVVDITAEKKTAEILEERIRQRTHELQVANEHLARSNQQLEQFAHVASHDMKEPIRKIALFSDRLRSELGDHLTPSAGLFLDKVQKAAVRLTRMVEGVLTYASVSAAEEEFESTALDEVLKSIEGDLELVIEQKKATLRYGDLPRIKAIPFLVHQLFYNLVNNSLKFAHPGTPALIELHGVAFKGEQWHDYETPGDIRYWEITLRDNGIGFDPENAETIFKAFSRLHSRDEYEGTGLGLALCRNIIEKHNGFIKAFGRPGEGATFKLLLPADTLA